MTGVAEKIAKKSAKKSKKVLDFVKKVRYNRGSLSKSAFPTSTNSKGKRGIIFEVALTASANSLRLSN